MVKNIIYISVEIVIILYTLNILLEWNRIKHIFICKKCNHLNKELKTKCEQCKSKMPRSEKYTYYTSIYLVRYSCISKDNNLLQYKLIRKHVIMDLVIMFISTVIMCSSLVLNIFNMGY